MVTVVPVGGYFCARLYPFLVTCITRVPVLGHFAHFEGRTFGLIGRCSITAVRIG